MFFDHRTYAGKRFLRERAAALLRGELYLLDAGISCRRITAALRELGLELGSLTAILITHTHADHISGLQTLLKRCAAPVFTTERAARELSWRLPGAETRLDALDFGIPQSIGEFAVTAFPTSHDAPGSCGFRLDAAGGAVGVLTDTGYVTTRLRHSGGRGSGGAGGQPRHRDPPQRPYPYYLKQRILGAQGHLSNEDAARFAAVLAQSGTSEIILAHLSRENNTPAMAQTAVERALSAAGVSPLLSVAPRDCLGPAHTVSREVRMQKVTILCVGEAEGEIFI